MRENGRPLKNTKGIVEDLSSGWKEIIAVQKIRINRFNGAEPKYYSYRVKEIPNPILQDSSCRRGYRQQGYIFSQTTGPDKLQDSHKRQTARRISKLYDWNKSSVKNMLGDCK